MLTELKDGPRILRLHRERQTAIKPTSFTDWLGTFRLRVWSRDPGLKQVRSTEAILSLKELPSSSTIRDALRGANQKDSSRIDRAKYVRVNRVFTVTTRDAFTAKVKNACQSCKSANIRDSIQYVSSPLCPSSSRKERIVAFTAAGNLSKTVVIWVSLCKNELNVSLEMAYNRIKIGGTNGSKRGLKGSDWKQRGWCPAIDE
ncbi:hypothetical protein F5146DRAFT_999478 [Armillaria mellea]|nr:hypothetical protein F5146DRAFT_999478 [Armillaria mellea]